MTSQHSIASCVAALALAMGSQVWAQTRPTLQGLQDLLNNTYTRQQVSNLMRPPDPACFDNSNRYVDCVNGTVTDTVTGLIWLKQANCLGNVDYAAAAAGAANLASGACGLTDRSRPGDWRLPTTEEWKSTLAPGPYCRNPSLTDTTGRGCFATGVKPFPTDIAIDLYWSATASLDLPTKAWTNDLHYSEETSMSLTGLSSILTSNKTEPHWVWPVRGAASTQPVYPTYTIRSEVSEGLAMASAFKAGVAEYIQNYGFPPANNAAIGADSVAGAFVTQVSVVNGRIDITYGNAASAAITGKVLSLTPYVASYGAIYWRCGNAAAPDGVLAGTGTTGPVAVYQGTLIDNTYLPISCRP